MQHATEDRPPLTVVGIEIRASNDRGDLLGAHWQRWMGEGLAARIEGRSGDATVAIYCDYEGDHTQPYTFMLGCAVAGEGPVPEGMTRRELPAGRYARVDAVGEQPGALIEAWMGIWGSGIERSFEADYEIHDPATPDRVAIYVR